MSKVDRILEWVIAHNTVLIEILIGIILILSAIALFFAFTSDDEGKSKSTKVNDDLEATLRKVLDSIGPKASPEVVQAASLIQDDEAPTKPATATAAAPAAAGAGAPAPTIINGVPPEEVEKLKGSVAEKDKTIQSLQAALEEAKKAAASAAASATPAAPAVDTKEMETKLQELQARLAEYEIIEDDIANLSNYRNENAKLKQELAALKGGAPAPAPVAAAPAPVAAPVAAAPAAPPAAAPAAAPPLEVPDDNILSEFEAAMHSGTEDVKAGSVATNETKDTSGDAMAEFEAAVAAPPAAPAAPPAAAAPPPAAPAPAAAAPSGEPESVDSLMSIDSSKLMEEALGIGTGGPGDEGGDPLSNPLNTDKLLEEALDINASGDGKG